MDLARSNLARLTQDPGLDHHPVWFPDGEQIAFQSARSDLGSNLFWRAANGTGTAERIGQGGYPQAFTPDGEQLLSYSATDIHLISLNGDPVARPLVAGDGIQNFAALSPNGRWITYQSNESGTNEVYVRPFPRCRERPSIHLIGRRHEAPVESQRA